MRWGVLLLIKYRKLMCHSGADVVGPDGADGSVAMHARKAKGQMISTRTHHRDYQMGLAPRKRQGDTHIGTSVSYPRLQRLGGGGKHRPRVLVRTERSGR